MVKKRKKQAFFDLIADKKVMSRKNLKKHNSATSRQHQKMESIVMMLPF